MCARAAVAVGNTVGGEAGVAEKLIVQTAVRAYVAAVVIVDARGVGTGRRARCSGCRREGEVDSGGRLLW